MKNMQTFYRWLTTGTQQENMYRAQLVGLTRTDLSKILNAAGFWDWEFWGSPGGPE